MKTVYECQITTYVTVQTIAGNLHEILQEGYTLFKETMTGP